MKITNINGQTCWEVSVSDESMEDQLLRIIMSAPGIRVKNFGRHTRELEDVFLSLVKEVEHGKQS